MQIPRVCPVVVLHKQTPTVKLSSSPRFKLRLLQTPTVKFARLASISVECQHFNIACKAVLYKYLCKQTVTVYQQNI